jgi:hypothetical protein
LSDKGERLQRRRSNQEQTDVRDGTAQARKIRANLASTTSLSGSRNRR